MPKRIAILNVATGKYINYVDQLQESVRNNFLKDCEKHFFLFTDNKEYKPKEDNSVYHIKRKGFPGDTLYRYHYFLLAEEEILKYDYVYYLDVDMRVVAEIGDEILEDFVVTIHPGFCGKRGTPETRNQSTACIPDTVPVKYCAGGFNGGTAQSFMKLSHEIKTNIDKDDENEIVAIWHDESHLNRYIVDNAPSIHLDPSYCYPESPYPWLGAFRPKILALDKNHKEIRK